MGSAAASWPTPPMKFPNSGPSSTYSGSPARSGLNLPVITPRPVPAGASFDMRHLLPSDQRQGLTRLCPRAVSCLDDAALRCTFRRWRGRARIRDIVRWHVYWYGRVLVGLDPDPVFPKRSLRLAQPMMVGYDTLIPHFHTDHEATGCVSIFLFLISLYH